MSSTAGFYSFATWSGLLRYAHTGEPLYYMAPLDYGAPRRISYEARPKSIRVFPPGSTGRGRARTSDPFTADKDHLSRFYRKASDNPANFWTPYIVGGVLVGGGLLWWYLAGKNAAAAPNSSGGGTGGTANNGGGLNGQPPGSHNVIGNQGGLLNGFPTGSIGVTYRESGMTVTLPPGGFIVAGIPLPPAGGAVADISSPGTAVKLPPTKVINPAVPSGMTAYAYQAISPGTQTIKLATQSSSGQTGGVWIWIVNVVPGATPSVA